MFAKTRRQTLYHSEEKLVHGLKLVIEAFAEMIKENKDGINNQSNKKEESLDKTFKLKEAAEYLQITPYRIRTLVKQGKLKHFRAGNRYLFRKSSLDEWIKEETEKSIKKTEPDNQYGKLRKIKD